LQEVLRIVDRSTLARFTAQRLDRHVGEHVESLTAGRHAAEERWDWRHLEERTMRVLDLAMGRQATDRRTVSA